jgi:hypothetical protein
MAVLSKARYVLAVIRVVNGLLAFVAPALIIKRFGESPDKDAAAVYGLRLFGVRTVLMGADLLTQRGHPLERTIDQAVFIHASDTWTAATLGASGRLRPAMAAGITAISALNTVLAVAAWVDSRLASRTEAEP